MPGEFVGKMSSLLGESREKTQLGVQAGMSGLLGGLADASSTSDGARRLSAAVDDADEGLLGNVGRVFGKGSISSLTQGASMLRPLLGIGGLSQLTGNTGKLSGLSGTSVTSLLGLLAPIVFSVLKSENDREALIQMVWQISLQLNAYTEARRYTESKSAKKLMLHHIR